MGILEHLKSYNETWVETNRSSFTRKEKKKCKSLTIVKSEYGFAIQFKYLNDAVSYIPLSNYVKYAYTGKKVNIDSCYIVTLERRGEDEKMYRIGYKETLEDALEYQNIQMKEMTKEICALKEQLATLTESVEKQDKSITVLKQFKTKIKPLFDDYLKMIKRTNCNNE